MYNYNCMRIDMQVLQTIWRLWRPGYFALAIACLIAVGSLMPAGNANSLPGNDIAHHVVLYGILSFFALQAVRGRFQSSLVLLAVLGFGAILEAIQPFFGRVAALQDVMANAAGIVAGLGVLVGVQNVWQRLLRRQWSRHPD